MDLEIEIDTLSNKKTEFTGMSANISQIHSDFSNSYLNKISNSEISTIITKIKQSTDRLKKGYENSNSWLSRYVTDVTKVEDDLANFESEGIDKPTEFKSEFIDIFSKNIIPILKTGYKDPNGLPADISEAKKAFIGGPVDDASQYTIDPNFYNMTKHMRLFDNTTGKEIADRGELILKKGETRVITVKLPTNTGMIGDIVRTTAADVETKVVDNYKITSSRSNLTGDLNNIQYVNYQYPHWPSDKSLLHNNTYDWIIHADETGARQISQTCEYTCSAKPGWYAKAMVRINIKIVD
jgi:hypothetical protein